MLFLMINLVEVSLLIQKFKLSDFIDIKILIEWFYWYNTKFNDLIFFWDIYSLRNLFE